MLRGAARVLKQHGYDTVLFSSAEAFKNHADFEIGGLHHSRHQPERWVRHRAAAWSQSRWDLRTGYLHYRER